MINGKAITFIKRFSSHNINLKLLGVFQKRNFVLDNKFFNNTAFPKRDFLVKKVSLFFTDAACHKSEEEKSGGFSDNIHKMSILTPKKIIYDPNISDIVLKQVKRPNALVGECSTYLKEQSHSKVYWYPWGTYAVLRSVREKKPIFLHIGYSTCYWCNLMDRECFDDFEIANILNDSFINIRVDGKDRPDIERLYMLFITTSMGLCGPPLSVFLTPSLKPITGGTYFPPINKGYQYGFRSLIQGIIEEWQADNKQFDEAALENMNILSKVTSVNKDKNNKIPHPSVWNNLFEKYLNDFDIKPVEFSPTPKFVQPSIFNFLFHYYARDKTSVNGTKCLEMIVHTLNKITNGGIHDHISGGFFRYSLDNHWQVPHFEKLLSDQAQIIVTFTDAYLATKEKLFRDVIKNTILYVQKTLKNQSGGYYSGEAADSLPTPTCVEPQVGAFYTWKFKEIKKIFLTKKIYANNYSDIICYYYNIKKDGNMTNHEKQDENVLVISKTKQEVADHFNLSLTEVERVLFECKQIMYVARSNRPRPYLDTKMVCSLNGLMMSALAQAGQALEQPKYIHDAVRIACFIKCRFITREHGLLHSCYTALDGSVVQHDTPIGAFLDDYAFLINGLLDLYEATLDIRWLTWAYELQEVQDNLFWDNENEGYFLSVNKEEPVIMKIKDGQDSAEPCGNSISCRNLLRLEAYGAKKSFTGPLQCRNRVKGILHAFHDRLVKQPVSLPEMMSAFMFYNDAPTQVIIAGYRNDPRTLELLHAVRSRLLPGRVLAFADPNADKDESLIVIQRKSPSGETPCAYVCRRCACSLPVTKVSQLEDLLDQPPAVTTL